MRLMQIPAIMKTSKGQVSVLFKRLVSDLADFDRSRKKLIGVSTDICLAAFSLWLAYTLRHGEAFSDFRSTWHLFLFLPLFTAGVFWKVGVYSWVVRSTNGTLFGQLVKGTLLSCLVLLILLYVVPPDRVNRITLFVIYGLLLAFTTISIRLFWQSLFDVEDRGEPVAVFGAGAAGRQLVSLLRTNGDFKPSVLIDDKRTFDGTTLAGLKVLSGNDPALKRELELLGIKRVILAIPSLSSTDYQAKLKLIGSLGFPVSTMPGIVDLMSGKAEMDDIRDVSIEDILGRSQVQPDESLMGRRVTNKTVLVTGGGGSIGSELCRQIVKLAPEQLLILDNTEANLYHITEEFQAMGLMTKAGSLPLVIPVLGSITDKVLMGRLIAKYGVDTIFHAAAYKHVPIVEAQPEQGVEVNVFGTLAVLDAALEHDVSDFVLISTDKAVRPTNAMGATKRVAELILQAKARLKHGTRISMVRFGNVLGSSGSVVPKFREQIQAGGPITLTHRDITRYFMTIPEAAQLVLQASAIAKGGDVFVLDMGAPVRIEQLAKTMVHLYGRRLEEDTGNPQDIEIKVEGLRPGEKMYEELFLSDTAKQTGVSKIFTADEASLDWKVLELRLVELNESMSGADSNQIKMLLLGLAFVPEGDKGEV